jgi:SHS2 domain-containing protein
VYRWVDHTAELELSIEAPTERAVFADALAAFAELVGDEDGRDAARHEIELESEDAGDLLADWLDELVYLADVEGFVPKCVTKLDVSDGKLRATVHGYRGEPRPIVKAVTRHGLALEPVEKGAWRGRVVLDV